MSKMKFALIGAGNIAQIYLRAFAEVDDAEVRVICNRTETQGRPLAERVGADWASDYEQVVRRDDIDAVVVATPSGTHAEIAVAAADAGKHILIEKPIDITLERVDRIISSAEKASVVLACVFPLRFAAGVHKVRAALEAGRLGTLTLADAYVKWFRPQSYYDSSWRGTWKLDGGGALMNQSIHNIDLLLWLAGPVHSVFGHVKTMAHKMETEDTASAVLTFENGALGVIQGATSAWPGDPARVELHGDRGTIILEEGRIVRWKLADGTPEEEEQMLTLEGESGSGASDPMGISHDRHQRQIVDMIGAIREGRSPAIEGKEARRSVALIRAIYESSSTGKAVTLSRAGAGAPAI